MAKVETGSGTIFDNREDVLSKDYKNEKERMAAVMAMQRGGNLIEEGVSQCEDNDDNNLLDNTGKFKDSKLENNYQKYVKRKIKKRKEPKDRLKWKKASDYWTIESPIARGNAFNKKVRKSRRYKYHEIHLQNGKRLDSYDPFRGEIISRKATDLDKISEETFKTYLSEFSRKYSKGTKIRSNVYEDIDGTELQGQYILEIPATNKYIKNIEDYKKMAAAYDVILRFTEE